MSEAVAMPPPMTIGEFNAFLEASRDDRRWELFGGRLLAMTNPTLRHAEIVGNLGAALRGAMPADRSCRVSFGDVRVQMSDDAHGHYAPLPDLMVWCGPMHGERNFVTTPMIIVEVLSPSSMDHDRGAKLRFYRTALPTLRHIVLVYQDQQRVEFYNRTSEGWSLQVLTRADDRVMFHALLLDVRLADIYLGTDLE